MALEGNAKDFGLSEIFQLISIQKKSGMLSISAEKNVAIFFQDGMIISTRDRRNRTRDPLRDYLLRYGFIERDEMNNLQQIQTESNMDLTDILVSEKYFSEDELRTIFSEQIYESVQEVLSWPKSHYKFIIGKNVLSGVKSYSALKVEGVLMESMRRIDEFPEMMRIFPGEDTIFQRQPMPDEREVRLEHNEEVLYELLEKDRSLEYLISHARIARFSTYEALKQLLEKGLLEFREAEKVEEVEVDVEPARVRNDRRKRLVPTFVTLFLLVASFAMGEYLVPEIMPPGWKAGDSADSVSDAWTGGSLSSDPDVLRTRALRTTLHQGLEEYYASKGSYPFTLEVLAVRKFISGRTVELAQQAGIRYRMVEDGESYLLD